MSTFLVLVVAVGLALWFAGRRSNAQMQRSEPLRTAATTALMSVIREQMPDLDESTQYFVASDIMRSGFDEGRLGRASNEASAKIEALSYLGILVMRKPDVMEQLAARYRRSR